jgi:hypothetical protein
MLLGPNLSYGNAQAQRNPRRLGHQWRERPAGPPLPGLRDGPAARA